MTEECDESRRKRKDFLGELQNINTNYLYRKKHRCGLHSSGVTSLSQLPCGSSSGTDELSTGLSDLYDGDCLPAQDDMSDQAGPKCYQLDHKADDESSTVTTLESDDKSKDGEVNQGQMRLQKGKHVLSEVIEEKHGEVNQGQMKLQKGKHVLSEVIEEKHIEGQEQTTSFEKTHVNHTLGHCHECCQLMKDIMINTAVTATSEDTGKVFVLSSGRRSLEEEAKLGIRAPTIDDEFEEYFSRLMI